MSSPSSEEVNAQRSDFGLRLSNSMAKYGRCASASTRIGSSSLTGAITSTRWVRNCIPCVCCRRPMAVPQLSNSSSPCSNGTVPKASPRLNACSMRHGRWVSSPSVDWPGMAACRPRFPRSRTPISSRARHCWADAITLLPYYGARSLGGVINDALNNGRGVFIASLTSNQEGASLQTAIRQAGEYKGKTVAYGIASTAQKFNKGNDGMGSVGLIIGATIGQWTTIRRRSRQVHRTDSFPGYGWQGAETRDLKTVFKGTKGNVLGHGISFHRHAWSRHRKIDRSHRVGRQGYSAGIDRGSKRERR